MNRNGYHKLQSVLVCCLLIGLAGCIDQNVDENMDRKATNGKVTLKADVVDLIGTEEFLFGCGGRVFCLDWDGNLVWQTEGLGSDGMVLCGDTLFVTTYKNSPQTGGAALLSLTGEVLWQRDLGQRVNRAAIGASGNLMAAGTNDTGILYGFSKEGAVLWTYDDGESIEQVSVAPDGSCVVFTDSEDKINCVRDGELIWSIDAGRIYTGSRNRTVAFSPDSSYLVYRFMGEEPQIKVSTLDSQDVWSYPLEDLLTSVTITSDSQYIIAACNKDLYKLTRDGELVWKKSVGRDNQYLASTPGAEYIALGCDSLPPFFIVVDRDGNVLRRDLSFDAVFAVAVSPDGTRVAYSNRFGRLYIFSNPPQQKSSL
ncbi:MAG: PQQ-binding-like beta-propeller repeat protein [Theionarchaea archaeon]|nr:PQQ-binding-like beta-propeller repeat protein [Theionarchaea archaeon]MBU7039139.1 PQQ-binding-like beta-propeller repeat protein [Theionarchaea archaeon]